jgi:hypothetical protein
MIQSALSFLDIFVLWLFEVCQKYGTASIKYSKLKNTILFAIPNIQKIIQIPLIPMDKKVIG